MISFDVRFLSRLPGRATSGPQNTVPCSLLSFSVNKCGCSAVLGTLADITFFVPYKHTANKRNNKCILKNGLEKVSKDLYITFFAGDPLITSCSYPGWVQLAVWPKPLGGTPDHPQGSKYPILKGSSPHKTVPLMVFGIRDLKHWVLGPSGHDCDGETLPVKHGLAENRWDVSCSSVIPRFTVIPKFGRS